MKAAISLLLIFVVWLLVGSAQANPYDDGVDAFMRKDYRKAYVLWLPLAKAGDPDAARNVGRLFHEGLGVERDYREASVWYGVAARKCNATAQNNLALLYGPPPVPAPARALWSDIRPGRHDGVWRGGHVPPGTGPRKRPCRRPCDGLRIRAVRRTRATHRYHQL